LPQHRFGGTDAPAIIEHARVVLYTPTTFISPRKLDEDLHDLCRSLAYAVHDLRDPDAVHVPGRELAVHVELVIVDEADRLKTATLEQLRDSSIAARSGSS